MKQQKDQKIESAIDTLLAREPKMELLNGAIYELRTKNYHKKVKQKKYLFPLLIAVAAIFIIIFTNLPSKSSIIYYKEEQLTKKQLSLSELKKLENKNQTVYFPKIESSNVSSQFIPNYYIYQKDDSKVDVLISMSTRVVNNNSIDEVTIVIELTTKYRYQKYQYFDSFAKNYYQKNEVRLSSQKVNGEYEEYATLNLGDLKYYLLITSPNNGAINNYFEEIYEINGQN